MNKIYKVISGKYYVGRFGRVEFVNELGLCMFYPLGGNPYRVCLAFDDLAPVYN